VDDQRHKQPPPRLALLSAHNDPKRDEAQLPTRSDKEGATSSKGAHISLVRPAPQHKRKWLNCPPKKHKKTNSRPNQALWTVFVNCAHWRGSTLAIYNIPS